ncbi:hypothetical protein H5410_039025, partial [Solanum commersonii]
QLMEWELPNKYILNINEEFEQSEAEVAIPNVYFLQKASSGLFYACYGYSNKATVPPFNSVKSCCTLCLPFAFNQESRELLTMEKDSSENLSYIMSQHLEIQHKVGISQTMICVGKQLRMTASLWSRMTTLHFHDGISGEVCLCSEAAENGRIFFMEEDLCRHTSRRYQLCILAAVSMGLMPGAAYQGLPQQLETSVNRVLLFEDSGEQKIVDNDEKIGIKRTNIDAAYVSENFDLHGNHKAKFLNHDEEFEVNEANS